jgi:hypothetical protein
MSPEHKGEALFVPVSLAPIISVTYAAKILTVIGDV